MAKKAAQNAQPTEVAIAWATATEEPKPAKAAPKAKAVPKKTPARSKAGTAGASAKTARMGASTALDGGDASETKASAPAFTGQALGMVETRGLVAAIEAADNMLKTADVALLGTGRVGSGLVTVLVCGEVSAVASAVQSGAAAAARLGEVVSTDIIARPVDDLGAVLPAQG